MPQRDDIMRDKAQVRDNLYGDPRKLGARVVLQTRFSTNPVPVAEWELRLVDLAGVRRALDAGCGTGAFLLPLARRLAAQGGSVVGLDLSEGTLGQARTRAREAGLSVDCVLGDVEALPFEDGSFDLVLANYMLYHVPNVALAIAELRRVLRPGGTLLVATNGAGHMRELWQMEEQAFLRAGVSEGSILEEVRARGRAGGDMAFALENGRDWLAVRFADVRLERYPDELRVTEVEPLVDYLTSMWTLDMMIEAAATEDERAALRERVVDAFRTIAAERIAADGAVRITKDTGAFIAH
jgi:SAM-dependent methyltransferase